MAAGAAFCPAGALGFHGKYGRLCWPRDLREAAASEPEHAPAMRGGHPPPLVQPAIKRGGHVLELSDVAGAPSCEVWKNLRARSAISGLAVSAAADTCEFLVEIRFGLFGDVL